MFNLKFHTFVKNIIMKKLTLLFSICLTTFINAQNFTLPKLDYGYNSLNKSIDSTTMRIHHSKHHQGYVNKLNKAVENSADTSKSLIELLLEINTKSDAIRNNAGGHYNHSLFWRILSPSETKMSNELKNAIISNFGNVEDFKIQLNKAAATQFGSGWAWLIVTPEKQLKICATPNQNNPLMNDAIVKGIPILGIDVWEHAYYLKYQNKRGDYLSAIWEIINWNQISQLYSEALENETLLNQLK